MAVVRTHFENNNEIGVFSKLTNAYCLIGVGRSANFFAHFESELDEVKMLHNSKLVYTKQYDDIETLIDYLWVLLSMNINRK